MAQVIELYSTMNPGDEVYIAPNDPDHYNEIEKVATEAYDHWFSVDDEDYTMEFGEGWDAD